MHHWFENIENNIRNKSDYCTECINLLNHYKKSNIAVHVLNVSEKAIKLAQLYNVSSEKAKIASIFHDISGIIPNEEKLDLCKYLDIDICEEEKIFPNITHQKLSREIAKSIFNIGDIEILNAISCHTTLRANPSKLDMIVFLADKIAWDQPGSPEYLEIIESNIRTSLELTSYKYIEYVLNDKSKLVIVHPWLNEAYNYFHNMYN